MNIRVSVCPKRTRYRNRSRKLPVSLWPLLAGCVSENVHLSLRFLLAMKYRAASASLRRPWEYNQRGDSGMNLKETSLKAVYSYRDACIERRQFTYGGWSVLGLKPDSPTGIGKREGARLQQHASVKWHLLDEWTLRTRFQSNSKHGQQYAFIFKQMFTYEW